MGEAGEKHRSQLFGERASPINLSGAGCVATLLTRAAPAWCATQTIQALRSGTAEGTGGEAKSTRDDKAVCTSLFFGPGSSTQVFSAPEEVCARERVGVLDKKDHGSQIDLGRQLIRGKRRQPHVETDPARHHQVGAFPAALGTPGAPPQLVGARIWPPAYDQRRQCHWRAVAA